MTQNARDKYNQWLNNVTDEKVLAKLKNLSDEEIENNFYKDLEFGTGGMRGKMDAGTNCLNVYTVAKASGGLAAYMLTCGMKSAAITYDSRLNSKLFSEIAAATLAESGITVYLTDQCMPTPFVSFLIRQLGADAGVNVTASHNPKEYNGYKVYDKTGCQVLDEVANSITDQIEKLGMFDKPLPDYEKYVACGKILVPSESLTEKYVQTVLCQRLSDLPCDITVAYTPLNGAGYKITPTVLKAAGVSNLHVVAEQSYPDGNFTTCPYPNPEKHEALTKVLELAKSVHADVVVANDPDSDRLGVAAFDGSDYQILSGNEVGILLLDYVLSSLKSQNKLPKNPVVIKSIVTSPMADAVAKLYGATVTDVLTGFKYIGDAMNKLESQNRLADFVFGFEESCGYLKGDYARDKDGVVAALLTVEMTASYKRQGILLTDRLDALYKQVGHFEQRLISYRFEGAEGAKVKAELLQDLRDNPLDNLAEQKIDKMEDLLTGENYPVSDVLIFHAGGDKLVVRPSGTEPLIKCYLFVKGTPSSNKEKLDAMTAQLDHRLKK